MKQIFRLKTLILALSSAYLVLTTASVQAQSNKVGEINSQVDSQQSKQTTAKRTGTDNNKNSKNKKLKDIAVTAKAVRREAESNYTVTKTNSAAKLDLAPKEIPQNITVFTEQLLQDQDLRDLKTVLDETPGITTVAYGLTGAGQMVAMSRGFPIENFQLDGMMVDVSAFGGIHHALTQDSFMYEQIDIVRGSTGLMTGMGDPAASINFIRKRPFKVTQGQLNFKYGRWSNNREELDYSRVLNQAGTWRARMALSNQKGAYFIDRARHKGYAFNAITEYEFSPTTQLTLGFGHQYNKINEAGPHNINLTESLQHTNFNNIPRNFNNASSWTSSDARMQSLFAGLEHRFANEWLLVANYGYSRSYLDRPYGLIGLGGYSPELNATSFDAGRHLEKHKTHAADIYLKGQFELLEREHDFVIGMNAYDSKVKTYQFDRLIGGSIDNLPITFDDAGMVRVSEWHHNDPFPEKIRSHGFGLKKSDIDNPSMFWTQPRRQMGLYFSSRLRPTEHLSIIAGGRYNYHKYRNMLVENSAVGISGKEAPSVKPQQNGFIPYLGLVYAITPSINAYVSYTGIWKPNKEVRPAQVDENGRWLPNVTGNTWELGVKTGFYDNRLNAALSVFSMVQKNFPLPLFPNHVLNVGGKASIEAQKKLVIAPYDEPGRKPYLIPFYASSGYKVSGIDVNIAGSVNPNWKISGGYVYQKQKMPKGMYPGESHPSNNAIIAPSLKDSFRMPKHSLKLFSSHQLTEKITLGGGMHLNIGGSYSYWVGGGHMGESRQIEIMKQKPYALLSLMGRYQINKMTQVGFNISNLFDQRYHNNEAGGYGEPRNITANINIKF